MAMTPDLALLVMWITFTAMAAVGVSGVLVWAVRARQFADQDRARYLPLTSGIPAEPVEGGEAAGNSEPGNAGGGHVST